MVQKEEVVKVLRILNRYHKGLSMLGTIGKSKNTYKILISSILSARARDVVTLPLSKQLFKKYPTMRSLANAKQRDVEKIIKSIGFYKNKAKNVIGAAQTVQNKYKGKVPTGGDRTLWLPYKHKTWYVYYNDYGVIIKKGKKDCPGNYIEAELLS